MPRGPVVDALESPSRQEAGWPMLSFDALCFLFPCAGVGVLCGWGVDGPGIIGASAVGVAIVHL